MATYKVVTTKTVELKDGDHKDAVGEAVKVLPDKIDVWRLEGAPRTYEMVWRSVTKNSISFPGYYELVEVVR